MPAAAVTVSVSFTATPTTYTVTYNANWPSGAGATSGSVPTDSNTYGNNATVTVRANTGNLAKVGYTFLGWKRGATSGTPDHTVNGSTVTPPTFTMGTANVQMYAIWTQNANLSVTPNTWYPSDLAEASIFFITTNQSSWDVGTLPNWIKASKSGTMLTLEVTMNTGSSRSATVNVTAGSLSVLITVTQDARKTVSLKMYYHPTYQAEFPNGRHTINAVSVMTDANRAFASNWNLQFYMQGQNMNAVMPMDSCTKPDKYIDLCDNACAVNHADHHKAGSKNVLFFRDSVFDYSTQLGVLIYRANLCSGTSLHNIGGIGGIADSVGGPTNMVDFKANAHARSVRNLQHELSHNFGVNDGYLGSSAYSACTPGQQCLMNLGFLSDGNYSRVDIWCPQHAGELNRDKQ